MEERVLKKDFMLKRARLMGRFKNINYRSRWFILTDKMLRYHDGSLESGESKEKGHVLLSRVCAVELADVTRDRANGFQVVYKDPSTDEDITLYIFAQHMDQRNEWIDAIRQACEQTGAKFDDKFHTGLWDVKAQRYTCCDKIRKDAKGCENVTFKTQVQNGISRTMGGEGHTTDRKAKKPPTQDDVKIIKHVIALYDYEKAEDTDLSLTKGEIYDVLDDSKPYWWLALNKQKEKGYIPANYVEQVTDHGLEEYDWFYPSTERGRSEEILKLERREGCFLVRNASSPGMYTLSIYTQEVPQGIVRHYHIKLNEDKRYYLSDKHAFPTIPELIHYHKHNSAGLIVRLRSPPDDKTKTQPMTAGLGHDLFEIDIATLELGEELGRGQFGAVHKAKYNKKMDVAVKQMTKGTMTEDDFIEEARTMMRLNHPNLVQLLGVVTKADPIRIVLEFMRYGALLQYLRRRKANLLKQRSTLTKMCQQVCSAMKYLEENNFIHRDLAARNCLVSEDLSVKVGDFGLARFVIDDEYTCSTGTKFPIKWASPEVLQYTRFSSKSDVWAFGVLMWEIWTCGDTPYSKMRNTEVIERVVRGQRLERPTHCTDMIYDMMSDTWQKDPTKRPPFAELLNVFQKDSEGYVS